MCNAFKDGTPATRSGWAGPHRPSLLDMRDLEEAVTVSPNDFAPAPGHTPRLVVTPQVGHRHTTPLAMLCPPPPRHG